MGGPLNECKDSLCLFCSDLSSIGIFATCSVIHGIFQGTGGTFGILSSALDPEDHWCSESHSSRTQLRVLFDPGVSFSFVASMSVLLAMAIPRLQVSQSPPALFVSFEKRRPETVSRP